MDLFSLNFCSEKNSWSCSWAISQKVKIARLRDPIFQSRPKIQDYLLCRIFNNPVICSYFNSIFRRMGVVNCKVHYTHWLAKKQKKDCWCRVPNCIVCLMTNYGVSMYKIAWSIEAFQVQLGMMYGLDIGPIFKPVEHQDKTPSSPWWVSWVWKKVKERK